MSLSCSTGEVRKVFEPQQVYWFVKSCCKNLIAKSISKNFIQLEKPASKADAIEYVQSHIKPLVQTDWLSERRSSPQGYASYMMIMWTEVRVGYLLKFKDVTKVLDSVFRSHWQHQSWCFHSGNDRFGVNCISVWLHKLKVYEMRCPEEYIPLCHLTVTQQ